MKLNVLVIGALNVDHTLQSIHPFVPRDSNEGTIRSSLGGVGFNIAYNLHQLGIQTSFLTIFGNDVWGGFAQQRMTSIGLDYSQSFILPRVTNQFASLHSSDGLFLGGINEMPLMKELTPKRLESLHSYINTFDVIILEANLLEETIAYLIKNFSHKHLFGDAVSQEKVIKWKPYLQFLEGIKVNLGEASTLLEDPTLNGTDAVVKLHQRGIKDVLITEGSKGIYYRFENKVQHYMGPKVKNIVNSSGAGDAFFAGYLYAKWNQASEEEAVIIGDQIACITLMSVESTHPDLNLQWRKLYASLFSY